VDGSGVSVAVIDAGGHATRMDGILARVAPGAAIVSVAVPAPARSDELIAGLDRAVDPNGDGDAHDSARVALVAYEEPFAGFPDGPEAQAVAGARALDLLVVAPAGNDGPAGDAFGDVAAPGASPDALTVGALDTRHSTARAHLVLRSGLRTLFDAQVPLALAASDARAVSAEVVAPRGSFFTAGGASTVAGRAALVPARGSPAAVVERAARAGAAAVLLYGAAVPPASLEVETPVPVVSLPGRVARMLLARLDAEDAISVMLGPQRDVGNDAEGTVAPFSSTGLAYDGSVKPDLVAPGVAVPSAGRLAVDGSSAAAAIVAADAALLAQTRPALGADALAGLLVGTAHAVPSAAITAQGAGAVDVGAAAAGELAASPATLALGVSSAPGRTVRASFALTNLSTRPLPVALGIQTQDEGSAAISFSLRPRRVVLAPGRSTLVRLVAVTASRAIGTRTTDGAVVASVGGGGTIRVPWAIAFGPRPNLIRAVTLSRARLTVDAGAVLDVAGRREIWPLERLDVDLRAAGGPEIGRIARLQDVLPGRYVFGITGRGPDGAQLKPGRYLVTVAAYPTDGGPPSRRTLEFGLR
ncbi:MAG: S8 family serine peptidase, partial [Actinobacteria bacterium]|nr:S8 family serine peptidase [Actinomycetota bacterium]